MTRDTRTALRTARVITFERIGRARVARMWVVCENTGKIRKVRCASLLTAVGLLLLLAAGPAPAAERWRPDVRSAVAFAKTRPGAVSFAVQAGPRRYGWRTARAVPAASLMKTLFLVAHLRRGDVRARALTRADRRLLAPMVRRSDDVAATTVFRRLGTARLRRLGRVAGLRDLRLDPAVWGMSATSARDQARLFARLDRLLPRRHRAYARTLLRTVVPSQRWGIGTLPLGGWRAYFKGGWGSGSGAVDHQAVRLERGGRRVSIAVLTTGNGSHAAGKRTLRGVFARLLRGLPRS